MTIPSLSLALFVLKAFELLRDSPRTLLLVAQSAEELSTLDSFGYSYASGRNQLIPYCGS